MTIWLWCARLTWVLLPVSVGSALSDALDSWSTPPARVATVLAWTAWALGLVALLAPRAWGLTCLRVLAPATVGVAVSTAFGVAAGLAVVAIASSLVTAAFACSAPVAQAAANAEAYGDEVRFVLRIPPSLFLGPVPLAIASVAAGVAVGPLLLADGRVAVGAVVTVVGLALAAVLVRSLHSLSRRWLVLVPAGLVVADPLTLVDPVLMRRESIAGVERAPAAMPDDVLDLRLGSPVGTVGVTLRAAQSFARRRGRRETVLQDADAILVSTVLTGELITTAGARRIAIV
jgi:hypothetical protein